MFGDTFDGVFRNTYVVGTDGTITHVYEDVDPEGTTPRNYSTTWTDRLVCVCSERVILWISWWK